MELEYEDISDNLSEGSEINIAIEQLREIYKDNDIITDLIDYVTTDEEDIASKLDREHIQILLLKHLHPEIYKKLLARKVNNASSTCKSDVVVDLAFFVMAPIYFVDADNNGTLYSYSIKSGTWTTLSSNIEIQRFMSMRLKNMFYSEISSSAKSILVSPTKTTITSLHSGLISEKMTELIKSYKDNFGMVGGVVNTVTLQKHITSVFDFELSKSLLHIDDLPCNSLDDWKQYKKPAVDYICNLLGPDQGKTLLSILSTTFTGYNPNKAVIVFHGPKDTGKSTLISILRKAFGYAAQSIPNSTIVSARPRQSAASPELALLGKGLMLAITQELGDNEKVRPEILKELRGNDTIVARELYGKFTQIKVRCIVIIVLNHLTPLMTNDTAAVNSMVGIRFNKSFLGKRQYDILKKHNPDDNCDVMIDMHNMIDELAGPMLAALLWEYRRYKMNGNKVRVYETYLSENEKMHMQISQLYAFVKSKISQCLGQKIRMTALLDRINRDIFDVSKTTNKTSQVTANDLEAMLKNEGYSCDDTYLYDATITSMHAEY